MDHVKSLRVSTSDLTPVSPYIFGHNLEHTRAAVCGGLSAQMLRNRKFAGKPTKNEGMAQEWSPVGTVFCRLTENGQNAYTRHLGLEKMRRINELQAQRVQNLQASREAGLAQSGLALKAGETYEIRVVTRTSRAVSLKAALVSASGRETYASARFALKPGEWEKHTALLKVNRKTAGAVLRLTFTGAAEVTFGAVSLMPADNFHGLRRDVVEALKSIGPAILRWPGGNFAGEYRWKDGLLDADERGPLQSFMEEETQPYSHGCDMNEMGTDDFLALCREVGAEPFLTINLVWNSPKESAEWVEYVNGDAHTRYGKLRAARGHEEPYRVRFWSLGNEMGYGHMEGPMKPAEYARMAGRQAEAMRKADPTLSFCSSGPYPADDWAKSSAAALSPAVNLTSLHCYTNTDMDYTGVKAAEATFSRIVACADTVLDTAVRMRACLDKADPTLAISYDEWNMWYAWYRPSVPAEGLYCAAVLHRFLAKSTALHMPVACYFQPVGEGMMTITPEKCELTANGQVFDLLKAHKGGSLCALDGLTPYDAVATVKDGILSVSVLNTSPTASLPLKLSAPGTLLSVRTLAAESLLPGSHLKEKSPKVEHSMNGTVVRLPKASVTLFSFRLGND